MARHSGATPSTTDGAAEDQPSTDPDHARADRHFAAAAAVQTNLAHVIRHARLPKVQRRVMAESGAYLDRSAYATLFSVDVLGGASLSDLASEMLLDISTVSRQVRRLEDAGLLERETHAEDRRVSVVRNTPEGHDVARRIGRAWQSAFADALSEWNDAELEELADMLDRLAHSLRSFAEQ